MEHKYIGTENHKWLSTEQPVRKSGPGVKNSSEKAVWPCTWEHCCAPSLASQHTGSKSSVRFTAGSSLSSLLPLCQRQGCRFKETNRISDVYFSGFDWLMCWTLSLWFTFQNKSAWQPGRGKMLGRGSDRTENHPPSPFFRLLDSAEAKISSVFLFPPVVSLNRPLLATTARPRNGIPTCISLQLFPNHQWLSPHPLSDSLQRSIRWVSSSRTLIFTFILGSCCLRAVANIPVSYFLTVVKHWA